MDAIQQKLADELTLATMRDGNRQARIEEIISRYRVSQKPNKEESEQIFVEWMFKMMDLTEKINQMPNRKLAWYFLKCPGIHHLPTGSLPDELINEVLSRLYPEWDGEAITSTEWGWITPGCDVVYLKEEYHEEPNKQTAHIYE